MSVLEQIHDNYAGMTKTHRKIANYLMENYNGVAFTTLEDLAGRIDVSTTSVIRFARTLGYPGYAAFQSRMRREMMKKISFPERLDKSLQQHKTENIFRDFCDIAVRNLQSAIKNVDTEVWNQAVQTIVGARHIYIYGSRVTFSMAAYLQSSLTLLHDDVHLLTGVGGLYPEELVGAGEGDVCITFMFPRYQRQMADFLSWLRKRGVKVVMFTAPEHGAVKHIGDYFLCTPMTEMVAARDSMVTLTFFLDCLLYLVMKASDYDSIKRLGANTEELLQAGFYFGG